MWAGFSAAVAILAAIQDAFWTVLLSVVIVGGVIALITLIGTGNMYRQIGRGGLSINEDRDLLRSPRTPSSSGVNVQERDAEIRQLLQARNEHRIRRGEQPLDVEAELVRLTAPTVDPALREEVRQLVVARNERRMRAGQEPLDVDGEVERQLRELT